MARKNAGGAAPSTLRIKLGACLSGTTEQMHADLAHASERLAAAKGKMMRAWVRWWEDNPPGEGVNPGWGDMPGFPKPGGGTQSQKNYLYHAGRAAATELWSGQMNRAAPDVMSYVGGECGHPRPPGCRYRWQAILAGHDNASTYAPGIVYAPLSAAGCAIVYRGRMLGSLGGAATRAAQEAGGDDGALLVLPLFGKQSDREVKAHTARLETRQMTDGHRKIFTNVLDGLEGWGVSDSKLVWRPSSPGRQARSRQKDWKKGEWFLHLAWQRPAKESGLDPSRTLHVVAQGADAKDPFLCTPDGGDRPWGVGNYYWFTFQIQRREKRADALRGQRKVVGSGKGHGVGRSLREQKALTRRDQHLVADASAQAVAEILKCARVKNCGRICYAEPPLIARPTLWHAARGLPHDWTRFYARLAHKCRSEGLTLTNSTQLQPAGIN